MFTLAFCGVTNRLKAVNVNISLNFLRTRCFITARNEVGARLCFYTCLWFCSRGSDPLHAGIHPPSDQRQAPLPRDQATPPEQTPWDQAPPKCGACWEIWATSGRYESYWNAILFFKCVRTSIHFVGSPEPFDRTGRSWILRPGFIILLDHHAYFSVIIPRFTFESSTCLKCIGLFRYGS